MFKGRTRLMIALIGLAVTAFGTIGGAQEPAEPELLPRPVETGDPSGVMTGFIDGEEFTLHTFLVQAGMPELSNTAYWDDWRSLGIGMGVGLSAHETAGISGSAWNGAIVLDFDLSADLEHEQWDEVPDVGYFESLANPYSMTEGTLELTDIEFVDEETLRFSGSFSGTFSAVMSDHTMEISAEFRIDWATVNPDTF